MGQEKFKTEDATLMQEITLPEQPFENRSDKLVGTILDGKIHIESLIGQGGMSVVYKGTHLVLNRPVAVKVILGNLGFNDKAVLRLQQEAKAAFSLSHKNLASVHDVSLTSDGLPYLVMDFAGGETLSELLKRGPLEPMRAIEIFSQICAGLAAAHAQGVIHRDIKPGNIMVEQIAGGGDLVKIVDFGIAKKVSENVEEIQKLTQTGEVFGTPLYMSPEQCRGEKLDDLSDIYSLGCVFYEALTGAPPFRGESSIATIMQHLEKDTPTPSKLINLPPPLISVLCRCLEKKSKDRYQSMDELYQDLQTIKNGGTTAKKYFKKGRFTRKKIIAELAFLCIVVVVCFAYLEVSKLNTPGKVDYSTVEACSEQISKNPQDAHAYFERAQLLNGAQDYTSAVADYTKCIKLSKKPAKAYAYRALAYRKLRLYRECVEDCNTALVLQPDEIEALYNRAIAGKHLGNFAQAIADSTAYLKKVPNSYNILENRAHVFNALGRHKDAINDCTVAIASEPGKADLYAERADAYNHLGDFNKAIADADQSIKLAKDYYGYTTRANALCHLGQFDAALADVDASLALHPERLGAKILKGQILTNMGKLNQALAICNQVIAASPHYSAALRLRAKLYKSLGKPDLADQDLEKVRLQNTQQDATQFDEDQAGPGRARAPGNRP